MPESRSRSGLRYIFGRTALLRPLKNRNHANLMATLRARLGQNCTIRTFLGKDVNTSHTVTLWGEADVVVAPALFSWIHGPGPRSDGGR